VLGELTTYKATLERDNQKIEFPLWAEEMPDETVTLYIAKETAKKLPKFEKFCADQHLDPDSPAAKALWKQVQQFTRDAGRFFTAAERQQLDRLTEPPAPER
jgi:cytochrome c556